MSPTIFYHIYIVDVVMWPKFGNSCISRRKVITTSISLGLIRKNTFFEGWSWFMFYNLGRCIYLTLFIRMNCFYAIPNLRKRVSPSFHQHLNLSDSLVILLLTKNVKAEVIHAEFEDSYSKQTSDIRQHPDGRYSDLWLSGQNYGQDVS